MRCGIMRVQTKHPQKVEVSMGNSTISHRDPTTGRIVGNPKIEYECRMCSVTFEEYSSNKRKFCSRTCSDAFSSLNPNKGVFKKGHPGIRGEAHPNWLGDNVTYSAVHHWLSTNYGRPKSCETCYTEDPDKRYEWANISGDYKRDRSDYKRLCKKCHIAFDRVPERSWETKRKNGTGSGWKMPKQTECRYGHNYIEHNAYYHKGTPHCRVCRSEREKQYRLIRKEQNGN
jgi:hypothetical protein